MYEFGELLSSNLGDYDVKGSNLHKKANLMPIKAK